VITVILTFLEGSLSVGEGREAVLDFLSSWSSPLSSSSPCVSLFGKIFQMAADDELMLNAAESCFNAFFNSKSVNVDYWTIRILRGSSSEGKLSSEGMGLISSLARFLAKTSTTTSGGQSSYAHEEVAMRVMRALAEEVASFMWPPSAVEEVFADALSTLFLLAMATRDGYAQFFLCCHDWLKASAAYLVQKDVLAKLERGVEEGSHAVVLNNACHILTYVKRQGPYPPLHLPRSG